MCSLSSSPTQEPLNETSGTQFKEALEPSLSFVILSSNFGEKSDQPGIQAYPMVHLSFHGNCRLLLWLLDNMGRCTSFWVQERECNVFCNPIIQALAHCRPVPWLASASWSRLPLSQCSNALIRQIVAACDIYQVSVLSDCMFWLDFLPWI